MRHAIQTVALVGTYVPRQCGIATFTKDLRDAVAAEIGQRQATVVAIDDTAAGYAYPEEVRFQIPQHKQAEYITAAELLNINQIDASSSSTNTASSAARMAARSWSWSATLRMPVITTLHTVLAEPSPSQRAVLKELARRQRPRGGHEPQGRGDAPRDLRRPRRAKIAYIPHGIPDVPFVDPASFKEQFGVEGRRVLLTFGLLSPGKGIEVAIRAMPRDRRADTRTSCTSSWAPPTRTCSRTRATPTATRSSGWSNGSAWTITSSSTTASSRIEELLGYIGVADIYITPYPNKQQITSGTLALRGRRGQGRRFDARTGTPRKCSPTAAGGCSRSATPTRLARNGQRTARQRAGAAGDPPARLPARPPDDLEGGRRRIYLLLAGDAVQRAQPPGPRPILDASRRGHRSRRHAGRQSRPPAPPDRLTPACSSTPSTPCPTAITATAPTTTPGAWSPR